MTDLQLIEILKPYGRELSDGSFHIHPSKILSAMRQAVQKGIDEYAVTQKGFVFSKWEIDQRIKILKAVEKRSIEFAEWHKDKYHWNWHYKKWTLGMITDKELIEKIGLTTEQLYQEYKKLNP